MSLETAYGPRNESVAAVSAFGEALSEQLTPVVQFTAAYGILNKINTLTLDGGIVTSISSLFTCNTGTDQDGFASVLSKRQITYRAGQGILARWTAFFGTPQANSGLRSGLLTNTDRLGFGYKGLVFGIAHFFGGESDIRELTVTTAASGGEDATVTIDGTAYTVPLTSGTVQHNSIEISDSLNIQVSGWDFSANGDQVVARSLFASPASTPLFSSSTAVASWSLVQLGVIPKDDFVSQTDWNRNTRPDLDVTKGNVYQVQFQYLGFGEITYKISNPDTGILETVHIIQYSNKNIVPNIGNPTFRIGWVAINEGNTTPVTLSGTSAGMFNEGKIDLHEQPRSVVSPDTTVGTSNFINLVTLRNRLVLGTKRNRAETLILSITGLTTSAKGATVELVALPTFGGELNFSYVDKSGSSSEVATDAVSVTGGRVIESFPVTTSGARIDLKELEIFLFPGEALTIAAKIISGASSEVEVSLNFVEDI